MSIEVTDMSADGSIVVGSSGACPFVWDAQNGMRSIRDLLEDDYGIDLGVWTLTGGARAVSAAGTMVAGQMQGTEGSYSVYGAWLARLVPVTGTCPGDLDYDGDVDLQDLSELLGAYGDNADGDLNCDSVTDLEDLSLLLSVYGETCG